MSAASSERRRVLPRGLLVSLLTVMVLALLLAAGEGVYRLAGGDDRMLRHALQSTVEFTQPCFHVEGRGADARLARNPTAEPSPDAPSTPRARSPGVRRLAVVGESNAAMFGNRLQQVLGSSCPERWEVLSCGDHGAGMPVVERRFEEVLAESPDAVLLIFGHNLRYGAWTIPPPWRSRLAARIAWSWLSHSALLCRLGMILVTVPLPKPRPAPTPLPYELERPADDDSGGFLRQTREGIESMARRARAAGVPLIAATLASNLLLPPGIEPRDATDPALLEARFLAAARGRAEAITALASAAGDHPRPIVEYRLGVWLLDAGRTAEAREHLLRAVALDTRLPRAPAALNHFLRRLAADGTLRLWDAERSIVDAAPQQVPAAETFADCCHLRPEAEQRELATLLRVVRGPLEQEAGACTPRRASSDDLDPLAGFLVGELQAAGFAGGGFDGRARELAVAVQVARDLAVRGAVAEQPLRKFLDGEALRAASPAAQAPLLEGIGEGLFDAGRKEWALATNERARAAAPTAAAPWVQRGLWLLSAGDRDGAADALRRAASLEPGRADARLYLAKLAQP